MKRLQITVAGVLLLTACVSRTAAEAMEPAVMQILRSVVTDSVTDEKARDAALQSLDRMARMPWPHVGKMPRMHVVVKEAKDGKYVGAWKAGEDAAGIHLVTGDLSETVVPADRITKIEPASFKEDLQQLLAYCRGEKREPSFLDFTYFNDFGEHGFPFHRGVYLLRAAYAAADSGLTDEAGVLLREAMKQNQNVFTAAVDEAAWQVFRPAMLKFQDGMAREEFLGVCKGLLTKYSGSAYDVELTSLVKAMDREAAAGVPGYMSKPAQDRTRDETIRYWVYQLREVAGRQYSDPGYPMLFSYGSMPKNAADELVRIGRDAIGPLIEALDDDTPTRTIAWQRSFYSKYFVLRRQDVAMKCLERITGCRFYEEGATFVHLYVETPERRASVIANVRAWWAKSKGKSQGEMIRNQMELGKANVTLRRTGLEDFAPTILVDLEGPEGIVEQWRDAWGRAEGDLNDYLRYRLMEADLRTVVQHAMLCFRENRAKPLDVFTILRFGDKAVYQELTRRWESQGTVDVSPYGSGEVVQEAAYHGKNWAIPIAALVLNETKMTGSRLNAGMKQARAFSSADQAMEEFAKLTGKDFGYNPDTKEAVRLEVFSKARQWWEREGRVALAAKIAEDHPPVEDPGNLLLSDAELAVAVKAISGDDAEARRAALAHLPVIHTYQIQRALLQALHRESDPQQRMKMLRIIQAHPTAWHVPALARELREDGDAPCRVLAGEILIRAMSGHTLSNGVHLETVDAAVESARELGSRPDTPPEVRDICGRIVDAWEGTPRSSK